MDKIKRYHIPIVDGMMIGDGDDPNGEWVSYDDHAAALSEAHATIARLEAALNRINDKAVMNAGEFARYVREECAALSPREGEG